MTYTNKWEKDWKICDGDYHKSKKCCPFLNHILSVWQKYRRPLSPKITEDVIEQTTLEWLNNLGYKIAYSGRPPAEKLWRMLYE